MINCLIAQKLNEHNKDMDFKKVKQINIYSLVLVLPLTYDTTHQYIHIF